MEQLRFDDRVAVITGGGNGVGRAHALLLAARGARVVVNDIGGSVDGRGSSADVAQRVVDEINAHGGHAVADTHSVVDEQSAQKIVETAIDAWGRIDVLVNNAGVLDTAELSATDASYDDRVIGTHLQGTINVTRAAWKHMVAQGSGSVVATSSGAIFGSPVGLAYQAAKGGVLAFTRGLATAGRECGIRVNAILPTAFTRMTETIPDPQFRSFMAGRFQPDRIAAFVAFLAHDSCPVSGEAFLVGGGRASRLLLGVTTGVVLDDPTPESFQRDFDDVMNTDDVTYPKDRLAEFQSYLGRLGFGGDGLDMKGGLVSGAEER
jgi:NAD(P)-dependent dehydrogenase (short-subunit alcohol dehydrogenase family)